MPNRTIVVLMGVLAALALGTGGVWLTGSLRSVPWLALGFGLFVWVLVGYFEWRARLQRWILGDAEHGRRAAP